MEHIWWREKYQNWWSGRESAKHLRFCKTHFILWFMAGKGSLDGFAALTLRGGCLTWKSFTNEPKLIHKYKYTDTISNMSPHEYTNMNTWLHKYNSKYKIQIQMHNQWWWDDIPPSAVDSAQSLYCESQQRLRGCGVRGESGKQLITLIKWWKKEKKNTSTKYKYKHKIQIHKWNSGSETESLWWPRWGWEDNNYECFNQYRCRTPKSESEVDEVGNKHFTFSQFKFKEDISIIIIAQHWVCSGWGGQQTLHFSHFFFSQLPILIFSHTLTKIRQTNKQPIKKIFRWRDI